MTGGLGGASIARIARRAELSQGTIYLYFENKDVLLRDVYLGVKREVQATLMSAAADAGEDTAGAIRSLWFALFEFVARDPDAFAYGEYVSSTRLLDDDARQDELTAMSNEVLAVIERGVEEGVLTAAPVAAIVSVLSAPAVQLARRYALSGERPDQKLLDETFRIVWRGIATD